MPRVDPRILVELCELVLEGFVELLGVTAVVAVAGARIEQRVAAEQGRLVRMRQQADMAHRVPRRIEALEFDRPADLDHVAGAHAPVHVRDAGPGVLVRNQFRAGRRDHALVAAGVVAVFVRVQDLGNRPAPVRRDGKAFFVVERVDRERFAGLGTGDQVVEVPVGVTGPDLLDDHGDSAALSLLSRSKTRSPPTQVCRTSMSSISLAGHSK